MDILGSEFLASFKNRHETNRENGSVRTIFVLFRALVAKTSRCGLLIYSGGRRILKINKRLPRLLDQRVANLHSTMLLDLI